MREPLSHFHDLACFDAGLIKRWLFGPFNTLSRNMLKYFNLKMFFDLVYERYGEKIPYIIAEGLGVSNSSFPENKVCLKND